jgi:molybdopterin-guanine dinucleotide biosynthesis protein B
LRIHAVILAGGEGRRLGGADKALLPLAGCPLAVHVLARLAPQVQAVAISANGDGARFAGLMLPVLADDGPSKGPLSGLLAALRHAAAAGADAVLSVPVDAPFLPLDLAARLSAVHGVPAFARAGGRDHAATALWPVALAGPLAAFLASGAKPRVQDFAALHGARAVDFPDPSAFANLNTPADLAAAEARLRTPPRRLFGVIGWKNAGKTTLMERLVATITARGFTVSTVKHVHHDVDLDQPGKDTFRHRAAGATEVILASAHRFALMREHRGPEPDLAAVLARLAPVDLVLVEGYKRDSHPKIEVWRAEAGQPLIQPGDPTVRAVATDAALPAPVPVPVLDLNDAAAIADFILREVGLGGV